MCPHSSQSGPATSVVRPGFGEYRGMHSPHRTGFRVTEPRTLESFMGLLRTTLRAGGLAAAAVATTAAAVTTAAGAVGGAVTGGAVGGISGAAHGVSQGLSSGARSTPAAMLTAAALGAAGLVEWPILLIGGGAVLVLRQLRITPATPTKNPNSASATKQTSATKQKRTQPRNPANPTIQTTPHNTSESHSTS